MASYEPSWEPDTPVRFPRRVYVLGLFVTACFFVAGVGLYYGYFVA